MTKPVLPADVLLGSTTLRSPQYGIVGIADERNRYLGIDWNAINAITLFGEPNAGKSYALGVLLETAMATVPGLSLTPKPLAGVFFHYSSSQKYPPEVLASIYPNDHPAECERLRTQYGGEPVGLDDLILLVPREMVAIRRREYPQIKVEALTFRTDELSAVQWKLLMGAVGEDDSIYLQVLNQIIASQRGGITLAGIREGVEASYLAAADKDNARIRLSLASGFIDEEGPRLQAYLKRGRLVVIDLRDEFMQKKQALTLVITMVQIFSDAQDPDSPVGPDGNRDYLQKLFCLDEAHKYLKDDVLIEVLTETIREMRHKATSLIIASQDPPSIPSIIIELCPITVLLKTGAPRWVQHIRTTKDAFLAVTNRQVAELKVGEAYIASKFASDPAYSLEAKKISIRPRVSKHGGFSKVAIKV